MKTLFGAIMLALCLLSGCGGNRLWGNFVGITPAAADSEKMIKKVVEPKKKTTKTIRIRIIAPSTRPAVKVTP